MRNLRCIRHDIHRPAVALSAVCWDTATDELIIAHGPTEADATVYLSRVENAAAAPGHVIKSRAVTCWPARSPNPESAVDRVVDMHHFGDSRMTCLVFAGGDIVTVGGSGAPSEKPHVEILGSIDAGLTAATWSPDEELLVVATAANFVVFMSRSFDTVAETNMTTEDLKMSKHVSVGWGKKETQFHGKGARAKALRDPTIPEKVDEGVLSPKDDGRTWFSWRGDGAFVAINAIESGMRRVIRVYSRVGELESVSEPVDGLEASLAWRPSGNLIAGVQRLPDRSDVVFFERNGLRHGQFRLREAAEDIALEWNADSTVLAVSLQSKIQLWTMGNYHWYLKQEITCRGNRPRVWWHPEKALQFAASTSEELLLEEYMFAVARGPVAAPHDHGAVAVIDGRTVKLTPFRTANVPSPMALFEIQTPSAVIDVAFARDTSAMAILHQEGVVLYSCEAKNARLICPKLVREMALKVDFSTRQITFSTASQVHALCLGQESTMLDLEFTSLAEDEPSLWTGVESVKTLVSCHGISQEGFIVQDGSGNVFRAVNRRMERLPAKFPFHLPWAEAVERDGRLLLFGLSRNGHLYAQSRLLVKNCTSFLVTPDHLVLTTANNFVKFVHLANPEELDIAPDDPENDERCRSIERGAKLVTAMPTNMNLVLQMPRGNLETISPRAMVLAGIRQLIDTKNYKRAFSFCRAQRVDMNILYDHNPQQFLDNVGLFLEQLKDVAPVDLFLSCLREEDVSQSMYKDTKAHHLFAGRESVAQSTQLLGNKKSKVNTICDAVVNSLRSRKQARLQNTITAHVCKNPPAIEDGLGVVAELMQEGETLAEQAVEHVCFLVDVNRVYDQALGLYNLDLALLVAQQSQRDPREYLPFVQNLHQMEPLRRQFAIDDRLGRHEKALTHLQKLGAFDELMSYTSKHSLHQAALGLSRYDEHQHRILTNLYAAHLESESKFREAGLAYESLGNFVKATCCYQAAGTSSWRECLFAAQQQTNPALTSAALANLASSLADALYEAKDYAAAATVHVDYLADHGGLDASIHCLCKGYLFTEATRLIALRSNSRARHLEDVLDPGLADALASSTEFVADCKAQLAAQVPRILELRRRAVEDPLSFVEGDCGGGVANLPDHVSVAASSRANTSASLFTRYTDGTGMTSSSLSSRATSRARRREEKKRARGRKGTVYEEEYLVNSVRRLVERVNAAAVEAERLVAGLGRRGMLERARAMEALVADVLGVCVKAVETVWPPVMAAADRGFDGAVDAADEGPRPTRGTMVLKQHGEAMGLSTEPPVVGSFARLSLLGS